MDLADALMAIPAKLAETPCPDATTSQRAGWLLDTLMEVASDHMPGGMMGMVMGPLLSQARRTLASRQAFSDEQAGQAIGEFEGVVEWLKTGRCASSPITASPS